MTQKKLTSSFKDALESGNLDRWGRAYTYRYTYAGAKMDWDVIDDIKRYREFPVLFSPQAQLVKETNPKDSVGVKKVPMSTVPSAVVAEVGLAMLEGARKYARHNYRNAGALGSVYYDAAMRHLMSWWEGEDVDPDSGISHVTKAISSLVVLRDAMICGKMQDDRPPKYPEGWMQELNTKAAKIIEKYPNAPAIHKEK